MSVSPISTASLVAGGTFVVGLALPRGAKRLGWIKHVSWLAAVLAPIAVGAVAYWGATRV